MFDTSGRPRAQCISMYTIVGLGNIGEKYARTRHNAGRVVLNAWVDTQGGSLVLSKKYHGHIWEGSIGEEMVRVLLPETFMNESGGSVKKAVTQKTAHHLIVLYDDIDLPLGTIRLSFNRGSGGHNGIKSIVDTLGTEAFIRIRIGISPCVDGEIRKPKSAQAVLKWVMGDFTKIEEKKLAEFSVRVGKAIEMIVTEGVTPAMNVFN